jgi:cytoskeletal protein CcmA (bactofilin family)
MWRKAEEIKPKSPPVSSPTPSAAPESPISPAAVSQGIRVKGEVSGQGDFFLDGEFEGRISLAGGTFKVGPHARVSAEIEAREVIIRGEVIGSLKSCERVYIASTGKLTGDMETHGIVIEDGAVLHSKVAVPRQVAGEVVSPEPSGRDTDEPAQPASAEAPPIANRAAGGK